ncbi:hypothetical protein AWW68_19545 [Roseivirga spongicola]|uniref:Uncharacterized protein n=1 Tax=Roseivirga spongicola TaxID=333140 RepID=A0A150XCL6_9BACT|nr:hypothetical protein [Roseivirga spongicola]KYG76441.1 hypothetical protein AWW68_19545 [Roseivirga spongicola]
MIDIKTVVQASYEKNMRMLARYNAIKDKVTSNFDDDGHMDVLRTSIEGNKQTALTHGIQLSNSFINKIKEEYRQYFEV